MIVDFQLRPDLTIKCSSKAVHGFGWFNKVSPECIAEMNEFLRLSKGKKVFMDVGAYHGMFTLAFAASNPDGKAYAFEPSPLLFDDLKEGCSAYPNAFPFQVALSDTSGQVEARSEFQSHIVLSPGKLPGTNCSGLTDPDFMVNVTRGDDLGMTDVDLIKIDVEGHEVKVIRGLRDTILLYRPTIFIELHGLRIVDDGCSIEELINLMKPHNYAVMETQNGLVFPLEHMLSYPVGSEIQRVVLLPQ